MKNKSLSSGIVLSLFFFITGLFVAFIVYGITSLLTPIALSFLLTFALKPAVDVLDAKGVPRSLALVAVIGSVTGIGYAVFSLLIPYISGEIDVIMGQSDILKEKGFAILAQISAWLEKHYPSMEKIKYLEPDYLSEEITIITKGMSAAAVKAIAGSLFYFILIPLITFFLLLQGESIYLNLISMIPNRFFEMSIIIIQNIKRRITGYMKGLMIQMGIFILIFSVGFAVIGLPHGVLVGLVAGVVNIIPYAGPVIGLVPAIAVSLLDPTGSVLVPMFVVYIFALGFDMGFTQPVVLAKSAQLHPLIALLSILTAQKLPGVEGALIVVAMVIAVPLAGIAMMTIQVMYRSLKAFRIL